MLYCIVITFFIELSIITSFKKDTVFHPAITHLFRLIFFFPQVPENSLYQHIKK